MNGMQQEIDQLKTNVADLRKNMGFDDELFDDLDDFDKKVSLMCTATFSAIIKAERERKTFSLMNSFLPPFNDSFDFPTSRTTAVRRTSH